MRKMLLGLVLVACVASVANAQLNLFYDVRADKAEILAPAKPYTNINSLSPYIGSAIGQVYPLDNNGGKGDHAIVYICPKMADTTDYSGFGPADGIPESSYSWDANIDWTVADIYLYAEFHGASQVVSSIGVNQLIDANAFTVADDKAYLETVTASIENGSLWSGHYFTGSNDSVSLKFVNVPVTTGSPPTFDAAAGIHDGSFEQIAKIHIGSGLRQLSGGGAPVPVATYGAKLAVNELLCTKVQYPGTAGDLPLNLGYLGGAPEAATASGSVQGATSATDDFTVVIARKGDFDFDGAAATSIDDFAYYGIALNWNGLPAPDTNINRVELYLADFDLDGSPATSLDDGEYYKHNVINP